MNLLRSWLGLERASVESELFSERLWAFLVNNQPRKAVSIRLGSDLYGLARRPRMGTSSTPTTAAGNDRSGLARTIIRWESPD